MLGGTIESQFCTEFAKILILKKSLFYVLFHHQIAVLAFKFQSPNKKTELTRISRDFHIFFFFFTDFSEYCKLMGIYKNL